MLSPRLPTRSGFDTDQYLLLLGTLVHWFSALESLLRAIFQARVGLSEDALDAIMIGGTPPVSRVVSSLKRLDEIKPVPPDRAQILRDTFEQLGYISALRDRFVHAGGGPFEGVCIHLEPLWKHRRRTKLEDNLLDPQVVRDAISDLQTVMSRLAYAYAYGSQDFLADAQSQLNKPWKYTHRLSVPVGTSPAKRARKRRSE